MKLSMYHEPIILPRIVVTLLVAALAAIGVEVAPDDLLGSFSLAEVLTAIAAAGIAYIGDGIQRRAFTDSPATTDRRLARTADDLDAIG